MYLISNTNVNTGNGEYSINGPGIFCLLKTKQFTRKFLFIANEATVIDEDDDSSRLPALGQIFIVYSDDE